MQIEVKIFDWFALAPALCCEKDWCAWAHSGHKQSVEELAYDLIPANSRRRMSLASKLAVQTALSLSKKHKVDSAIFVSRHGELQRTCKLITEILSGDEASPIAFSQSVHNTASGLFSIAAQEKFPITSLAAGKDSFQQGMIEACARLNGSSDNTILLVYFDDVLPEVYSSFVDEELFPCALGLILKNGEDWKVASADAVEWSDKALMPQALQFLQHYLNEESQFTVSGTRHDWMWTCVK